MRKASSLSARWRTLVFFLTALLLVAADQFSKQWIRSYPEGQVIFKQGFFQLIHVPPNTGAVFGLFQGQSFALTIVAMVGIVFLLVFAFLLFYRRFPLPNNTLVTVALGLILGGTVGNLIDRLSPSLGGVTDFIDFGFWPAFNIADSATVVGVIIFAVSLLFLARDSKG
jgi:signal peptidase II